MNNEDYHLKLRLTYYYDKMNNLWFPVLSWNVHRIASNTRGGHSQTMLPTKQHSTCPTPKNPGNQIQNPQKTRRKMKMGAKRQTLKLLSLSLLRVAKSQILLYPWKLSSKEFMRIGCVVYDATWYYKIKLKDSIMTPKIS